MLRSAGPVGMKNRLAGLATRMNGIGRLCSYPIPLIDLPNIFRFSKKILVKNFTISQLLSRVG